MHVRLRLHGQPDAVIVVNSKLMKIELFRGIIKEKFDIGPKQQRLFYGGKLLEDGYTFHDYNIKLNDVIQLMVNTSSDYKTEKLECKNTKSDKKKPDLKDGVSKLYAVGDLVDVRDKEMGAWYEGRIARIVYDPKYIEKASPELEDNTIEKEKSDSLNKTPPKITTTENRSSSQKKNTILEFFSRAQKKKVEPKVFKNSEHTDDHLLFKIQFDDDEKDDSDTLCTLKEIRPRARKVIDVNDIVIGQTILLNHNIEEPLEKGHWYDFKVDKINKNRKNNELVGTLYIGAEAVPQNDTTVIIHDKIFAIEDVIPVSERTEEYSKMITTPTEKRSAPIYCLTCRDREDKPCKDCGCCLCSSKGNPDKIILCDECNDGYHMDCLTPPMVEVPDEDWYCPSCKRDPNDVVAPGSSKQAKKMSKSKSQKDWGRGMACVGKTKTCPMPKNHFGPIPGIDVGMCWKFRIQLSESGVHRPPVSGIHGRDVDGAYSIVLSGGYEDDVDNGYEFTYTGSGGRDLSGNKRTAQQSCDQTLTRENKALARNCAVARISDEGADAGDSWRDGKPVRVVRSYKMLKHFPMYAPKEGIRYDGIYKVVKYYPEKGLSGFRVWKYLLRRDDPSPAPWESGAKQYPIVFPDGFLEAEAEKQSLKENKKRKAVNSLTTDSEDDAPALKKKKIKEDKTENPKKRGRPSKNESTPKSDKTLKVSKLENGDTKSIVHEMPSEDIMELIKEDKLNSKLWDECIEVCKNQGRKDFVDHVFEVFQCIICQELVSSPVTTSCLHNFCTDCMKLAFKCNTIRSCPYCRQDLSEFQFQQDTNNELKAALQAILPGYDAGRK